ncbi:hypothetical protein B7486_62105, partial [cyanobacterium TDX16]
MILADHEGPRMNGARTMRSRQVVQGVLVAGVVLLGLLAGTGVAAAAPPSNDDFADATVLGASGSLTGSNVDATSEAGEPDHGITANGIDASVWYRWTAPADGFLVVSTRGSDFDTVVGVYTGAAVNALSLVEQNDDTDGSA